VSQHDYDFADGVAAAIYELNGQAVVRVNPKYVSDITGRTQPYKALPYRLRPALEEVANYVRGEMIPRTFRKEGPGWRPLAKRTQRERAEQGYGSKHPILIRTRDLFKELTDKAHPKHVEVIRTGKYSRVSIGGSSDKFMQNQLGSDVYRIPPRPMIPGTGNLDVPQRDRIAIKKILDNAIRRDLKRG
jgi:hypothetical protein